MKWMMRRAPLRPVGSLACALLAGAAAGSRAADEDAGQWPVYGGAPGGGHYTSLAQITAANVGRLREAWVYRTGDFSRGAPGHRATTFEATPILVHGTLYFCTPYNRVIALQAETGQPVWSHEPDPKLDRAYDKQHSLICRGVSYWEEPNPDPAKPCQGRIFQGVLDGRLEALDARTGQPCADFASGGTINLNGLDKGGIGDVNLTSAPVVFENLVIVGSAISDNHRTNMPSGFVRAFDARTGEERWHWSAIPEARRGLVGAGNVWAPMAVDTARGLLYAPTTSPSPDFWGGQRGEPLPSVNAIVALEIRTGAVRWQFQTVHHDLWDYDLPAQPTLVDVHRGGRTIAAVVQPTKTGYLFVLDRENGEPLFPLVDRGVPASSVAGEPAADTQPAPLLPRPIARQGLAPEDVWGITPIDRAACVARVRALRNDGFFTPPSEQGSVQLPWAAGGSNWGGMGYDPRSHLAILNAMNIAGFVRLFPAQDFARMRRSPPSGVELAPQIGAPLAMERGLILSPLGIPCSRPPWGTISAVDLDTGELRWQHPFGTTPIGLLGIHAPAQWGAPNLGGPLVTASGLVFIGATSDGMFRAMNTWTGEVVWEHALPYPGAATPMSFLGAHGRQFIVIAAGGSILLQSPIGDALVAFALTAD
jgi:quinoprotein glucose dehydrogenase